MLRPLVAVALLTVSLAACEAAGTDGSAASEHTATETAAVPTPAPTQAQANAAFGNDAADDASCDADKLDRWLNALPTDDVKREIAATVGERAIRYYAQGDPITMDFSPDRLNVELGKDGRIKLFRCG